MLDTGCWILDAGCWDWMLLAYFLPWIHSLITTLGMSERAVSAIRLLKAIVSLSTFLANQQDTLSHLSCVIIKVSSLRSTLGSKGQRPATFVACKLPTGFEGAAPRNIRDLICQVAAPFLTKIVVSFSHHCNMFSSSSIQHPASTASSNQPPVSNHQCPVVHNFLLLCPA
jgi:hypothetical protein